MNSIQLPTDNLYKFLALTGLALVVLTFVYPYRLVTQIEEKLVDNQAEADIAQLKVEDLKVRVRFWELDQDASIEAGLELKDRLLEVGELSVMVRSKNEKNSAFLSQIKFLNFISLFTGGAGLILSFMGFSLWYKRVQIPADKRAGEVD